MIPVVLGLSSAVVFGAADFFGGLAARRITPLRATFLAACAGLLLMAVVAPVVGGDWTGEALMWGVLSGMSGAVAILLLYAALAIGPMSILSPLTAVISAVVPMAWGLIQGERLTAIGYLGLGLALVAVVLVGFVPDRSAVRPTPRGILIAVGSGILIGIYLTLIDRAPDTSGLLPLLAHRGTSALLLGGALLVTLIIARGAPAVPEAAPVDRGRGVPRSVRGAVLIALCCGLLDTTANAGILLGLRLGELSVMSVLVALYPAGTILLAGLVLRERVSPVQWTGLGLAVAAAVLLGSHRELSEAIGAG